MFEQVFKNIDDILCKDPRADSELAYAKVYRKKCFGCYPNEINDLTASSN